MVLLFWHITDAFRKNEWDNKEEQEDYVSTRTRTHSHTHLPITGDPLAHCEGPIFADSSLISPSLSSPSSSGSSQRFRKLNLLCKSIATTPICRLFMYFSLPPASLSLPSPSPSLLLSCRCCYPTKNSPRPNLFVPKQEGGFFLFFLTFWHTKSIWFFPLVISDFCHWNKCRKWGIFSRYLYDHSSFEVTCFLNWAECRRLEMVKKDVHIPYICQS